MATYNLNVHLSDSDAPEVSPGIVFGDGSRVAVIRTGGALDVSFFATPDQLLAIGNGIIQALGHPWTQPEEVVIRATETATVNQALAILRAAMLREFDEEQVVLTAPGLEVTQLGRDG